MENGSKKSNEEGNKMRRMSFYIHCSHACVNPEIALENKDIVKALKDRDDKKVIKLLRTKF